VFTSEFRADSMNNSDPLADPSLPVLPGKESLCGLPEHRITDWLAEHDHPAYRAEQLRQWIYGRRAESIDEMTDLPEPLRAQLADDFDLFTGQLVRHQVAGDRTEKLLVQLADGKQVECVLMHEASRWTACISTQVGCAMGCVFCASGLLGLDRNLTRAEILEQILRLTRRLEPDQRLTNLVVMGIGEPLANLPALLEALERSTPRTGSDSARDASPSQPSGCPRASGNSPMSADPTTWPFPCTLPTMNSATDSSRSTIGSASPRSSKPPTSTSSEPDDG
jgi:23S rRNA (adenine2503-C2)-methyltransferase